MHLVDGADAGSEGDRGDLHSRLDDVCWLRHQGCQGACAEAAHDNNDAAAAVVAEDCE